MFMLPKILKFQHISVFLWFEYLRPAGGGGGGGGGGGVGGFEKLQKPGLYYIS